MVKKKILLADDVKLFVELEKTFFRREEVELLVASNGQQAYEIVAAQKPDLVFMDLFMPEMNGDECCRKIKDNPELAAIPVVMVTHGGQQDALERCRQAGCDDILLKPINRGQFLETSRKFLQVAERGPGRVKMRLTIRYGADGKTPLADFSLNMSTGGLFLETAEPLPVDTPLFLEFAVPGEKDSVSCQARVAWVNPPEMKQKQELPVGMGLQFIGLSLEDMYAIRSFLQKEISEQS